MSIERRETGERPQSLPPLPFIYEKVIDPEEAEFKMRRISSVMVNNEPNKAFTDKQILANIEDRKKETEWFYQDYWREKGKASEQIELKVDVNPLTLYNFDKNNSFDDEKLSSLTKAISQLGRHFPEALSQLRWILVDDTQQKSIYGDTQKFPTNGQVVHGTNAFRFFPRGTRIDIRHRIPQASVLEGTFVHETAHLIQRNFYEDWTKKFQWKYCDEFPDDWEYRTPPEGGDRYPFNKLNNEMMPQYQFPLQPESCVNYYAKLSLEEDIAESITAYIYNPDLLQKISPEKFQILGNHDRRKIDGDITTIRIAANAIHMPELKSTTITYYIQE